MLLSDVILDAAPPLFRTSMVQCDGATFKAKYVDEPIEKKHLGWTRGPRDMETLRIGGNPSGRRSRGGGHGRQARGEGSI